MLSRPRLRTTSRTSCTMSTSSGVVGSRITCSCLDFFCDLKGWFMMVAWSNLSRSRSVVLEREREGGSQDSFRV